MIIPVGDRVIVQSFTNEKSVGGVFLPSKSQEQYPQEGVVIAVGPGPSIADNGKKLTPIEVKPGDHILFTKYGRTPFKHGGKDYIVTRLHNIYCKIECGKPHPISTYDCDRHAETAHQPTFADEYSGR